MKNITEHQKSIVKSILDDKIKNGIIFKTQDVARNEMIRLLNQLKTIGYITNSSIKIKRSHIIEVYLEFAGTNFFVLYSYDVKERPFNFDCINRSLVQLRTMVDGVLVYNMAGGYKSIDELHGDMQDLNYFFDKVNSATKFKK